MFSKNRFAGILTLLLGSVALSLDGAEIIESQDFSETWNGEQIYWEKAVFSDRNPGDALREINFGLALPDQFSKGAGSKYPLVVYLHGAGARGSKNENLKRQTARHFAHQAKTEPQFNCFVLSTQVPQNKRYVNVEWDNGSYQQSAQTLTDELHLTESLILYLTNSANDSNLSAHLNMISSDVDTSRIYIVGDSMGAFGTWDLIGRGRVPCAGAIAVSGSAPSNRIPAILSTPVWTVHGIKDEVVPNELPVNSVGGGTLGILGLIDVVFDNSSSTELIQLDRYDSTADDPDASDSLIYTQYPQSFDHADVAADWTGSLISDFSTWLFSQYNDINLKPFVDLGSDHAYPGSATSARLTSTVTDDGRPEGGTLTYQWRQLSGPSSTISTPASSATEVTLPEEGVYIFRLTVSDSDLEGYDEIRVTRAPPRPPIPIYAINCGGNAYTTEDGMIQYEADNYFTSGDAFEKSRSIAGTEDDELFHSERYAKAPATVDYAFPVENGDYQIKLMWSENTGSGRLMDVSLEGQLAIDALDVITLAGSDKTAYERILDVSVTDGSLDLSVASDSNASENFPNLMAIQVLAVETGGNDNVAPVVAVNSGADVELSKKSTSTYLEATVSDDGLPGDPLTYTWTQVSGPGAVTFGMPSSEDTTVKLPVSGTYVLRLTVSDGELSDSDDITLIRQDESAAQPIIDVDIPEVTEVVVVEKQAGKEMTVSVQAVASGTYHMEHAVDLDSDWNLVPGMVETGVLAGESVTMVTDVPEEQTGFFRIVFTAGE